MGLMAAAFGVSGAIFSGASAYFEWEPTRHHEVELPNNFSAQLPVTIERRLVPLSFFLFCSIVMGTVGVVGAAFLRKDPWIGKLG